MMLAIFIFCILILVLATNVTIHIKSINDTVKAYLKIGVFYMPIPHRKILSRIFINKDTNFKKMKKDIAISKRLTFHIFSHSSIDHVYIAKFSKVHPLLSPVENGLYIILCQQFRGFLQRHFKYVDSKTIRLQYDPCYENMDYSISAHLSVISLLWALMKSIKKR